MWIFVFLEMIYFIDVLFFGCLMLLMFVFKFRMFFFKFKNGLWIFGFMNGFGMECLVFYGL